MRSGPKMSAPWMPVASRSASSTPHPTANSMPPCGVAYVKTRAMWSVAAPFRRGMTRWITDRQMSPPIEWATRNTLGAPVLRRTVPTRSNRLSAARSIENSTGR